MHASNGAEVAITALDPSVVDRGWQGWVRIHGTGFDRGSFAFFDRAVPVTRYRSAGLLEAQVGAEVTADAGTRRVRVHTNAGDVSNEAEFHVR